MAKKAQSKPIKAPMTVKGIQAMMNVDPTDAREILAHQRGQGQDMKMLKRPTRRKAGRS